MPWQRREVVRSERRQTVVVQEDVVECRWHMTGDWRTDMDYIWYGINTVVNGAGRLNRQEWMYVLAGVTLFGAFCMRGFKRRI